MVIMKVFAILMIVSAVIGKEQHCSLLSRKFALEDLNTVVDTTHKQLIGSWLSTRCEIRSGPQYLLRSYTFREDGTYKLIQHHYWDSSCSLPKFTITSLGLLRLTRNLVYNPDAAIGFIRPVNMSLIPQGSDAAQELKKIIAENCPDYHWQQWKKYEEYLLHDAVFKNNEFLVEDSIINLACLGNLKRTFSELKFIKIEIRPIYSDVSENPIAKFHRVELILGDTISEDLSDTSHMSIGFQPPLLKWTKEHKILAHGKYYKIKNVCGICENLQRSDRTPPHLLKQPELPPYIQGDWISLRCEVRSMGFYLTRRFSFLPINNLDIWTAEHKFYLDPFCAVPKFSVNTAGNYQLLDKNSVQSDATNMNLNVGRVSLTIFDRKMSEQMSKSNACDIDAWEVDIPYNIKHNYKCSGLNLVVPSTQYEIVKFDINYEGSSLLYLGSTDQNIFSRVTKTRPTSYSEPLMKCMGGSYFEDNWESIVSNKIYLSSHGLNHFISTGCYFYVIVFLIYCLSRT